MVNWSDFEKLPGSVTHNFETLCRSLVWLHYNRFGKFKAVANQPGIEFDLQLDTDCTLGKSGKWFGWQCRWWDLPSGKAIGKTRRAKIEDALNQTLLTKPDVTDWVLWTRHSLTKGDQAWFYSLKTKFDLHLWTSYEAETLLCGDAEILKQTYFGNLILTPERLFDLHEESVAPIRTRWMPDVHQMVDAERTIRRILGQPSSWDQLQQVAKSLDNACAILHSELVSIPQALFDNTSLFITNLSESSRALKQASVLLETGDLGLLRQVLEEKPERIDKLVDSVPRKLRGARLSCGLLATNALAYLKSAYDLLNQIASLLKTRMIAVVAAAGGGKTQLSAELTAAQQNRPAGILLLGRNLHHGQTLDDLARRVVINGEPVKSMQALLAAVNAAGDRARCRIPIVIDGLNEAEDPRDWKPLLSSLDKPLQQFGNVLVVCTLRTGVRPQSESESNRYFSQERKRPSFSDQALPDNIYQIQMSDFEDDTICVIRKYFAFFRIKADVLDQPSELLSHPLTLRIFCEVTNPTRSTDVGMEAIPRSLASMFERYLDQAAQRIEELSSHTCRHFRQDIYRYLDIIGHGLWNNRSRELNERGLRLEILDDRRDWNNSIITLLEQEGVLLRIPGEIPGMESVVPVYDLLGGYLIASSLISSLGRVSIIAWLKENSTIEAINGDYSVRHPLAEDIFRFLAALVPQRLVQQQLWQLVEEPLRTEALELATLLEGKYLDAGTVDAISQCILQSESKPSRFFRRFVGIRSAADHPLNATFLDSVLRKLTVAQRDILWTEWLRKNEKACLNDLNICIENWKQELELRTTSDHLKARWIMWLLTTTIHRLRDTATLALYWFGRGNATMLFELAESAVELNDPYIPERMMAASYGVAMAISTHCLQNSFRTEVLPRYAVHFYNLLFKANAPFRTTHVLVREYVRRLLELAIAHNPALFSIAELSQIKPPYSNGGRIEWQKIKGRKQERARRDSPLRMDFENYTLGRLVKGRRNYDYENEAYKKVHAQVLWRISDLGWVHSRFEDIEKDIERNKIGYSRHDNDVNKVDRYGKKYSWIAYFELDGWLQDKGLKDTYSEDGGRTWDVDIDPSFPEPSLDYRLVDIDLLGDPAVSLQNWIENGDVPDLRPYFIQEHFKEHPGPWVMLDGYVSQEDDVRGRSVFAFVRSFLVANNEKEELISFLQKQALGGRWLPEKHELHYTFSGEVPWCTTFPNIGDVQFEFQSGEHMVKTKKQTQSFFLDGRPVELTYLDLIRLNGIDLPGKSDDGIPCLSKDELARVKSKKSFVEVDEIEYELTTFDVIVPVCDMRTAGKSLHNVPTSGVTLVKSIADLLELTNIPQTYDLQSRDAERATIQSSFQPESYKNSERFFFIHQKELTKALESLKMSLVWAVWGERELSLGQFKRSEAERDGAGQKYADFQAIYSL